MRGTCIAALAALVIACGGPSLPPERAAIITPAASAQAIEYLHDSTELVIALARLGGPTAAAVSLVVPEAGAVLDELVAMGEHGVDISGTGGFALLDFESRTAVGFATVTDRGRLRVVVEASGAASVAGDALIVTRSETDAVVLRGDHVFVIRAPAPSVRDLAAVRIATVSRDESLAQRPSYRAAIAELELGADAAGYVSMASAARGMLRRIELWEFDLADLAAKPSSDDPRQRVWIETALRVADAEKHLATDVLGALGGIGFGIELRGEVVALSVVADPGIDSLVARLLADHTTSLRLAAAAGPGARLVVAAHTDAGALVEFVDVALAGFGLDGYGIKKTLEQLLEIDIAKLLVPAMSGEVGFAIGADDEVHIAFGLTQTSELAAALGPTGRKINIGATVHIRVIDDQLVASTDVAFFERVRAAPAAKASGAAILTVGPGELADLFDTHYAAPVREPIVERDGNDDVPFSPEYLTVEKALLELESTLGDADERVAIWHRDLARARAKPLGVLTIGAVRAGAGAALRATGALKLVAKSLADALEASAKAAEPMAAERELLEQEITQLLQTRNQLADQLLRIRVDDIQAADGGPLTNR